MLARRRMFQDVFQELYTLQRDLLNLFGRSFGFAPAADLAEVPTHTEAYYQDGRLVIRAELAGVDPQAVDISVAGRILTIKGERKAPEVPLDDRLFSEIAYGRFERTVTVPEGLDTDQVKAVWHNGMLEITIPVSQALRPRKVPVEIVPA
ncbi:MAG: Hsp20/alpha crystallin family protein [Candidatus Rokubacteria bacterium]|jgi:HSP20 family protein|nr:Hsp20/alpha crystallin family protein [Candidatus Rokubacteria bacterium]